MWNDGDAPKHSGSTAPLGDYSVDAKIHKRMISLYRERYGGEGPGGEPGNGDRWAECYWEAERQIRKGAD